MKTVIARTAIAFATSMFRTRRTARMLHQLSDAQLKDIGLTRSDSGHVSLGETTTPFD